MWQCPCVKFMGFAPPEAQRVNGMAMSTLTTCSSSVCSQPYRPLYPGWPAMAKFPPPPLSPLSLFLKSESHSYQHTLLFLLTLNHSHLFNISGLLVIMSFVSLHLSMILEWNFIHCTHLECCIPSACYFGFQGIGIFCLQLPFSKLKTVLNTRDHIVPQTQKKLLWPCN